MALRGHVFDKQLFSSDCYALVTDTFLNKNSGIIKGCDLTNTTSTIYIGNGYFVVKGRPIQEEGGTTIEVETGTLEGIYCKLICEIDMSQTNTTTTLNQVSYKVLEDTTDYPELIQEDITDGGTIYQFELAKFKRTLNGIEEFVDTRSFLNFNSIYEEIKKEIKKIEEGSIFLTEEQADEKINNAYDEVSSQLLKKVYSGHCDSTGTTVDTGISVNGGYGGMAYLIAYSFHTSNKDNTGAGLKLLRCGFDGNNYQITDIASSSGNASNIGLTFSVSSAGTLIFWNGGTGRSKVSIFKLIY